MHPSKWVLGWGGAGHPQDSDRGQYDYKGNADKNDSFWHSDNNNGRNIDILVGDSDN